MTGSVDWRGLPIKRPYPWERDVTVCIAAACRENNENRIVFCYDRRAGSALGSSETALKERSLFHSFRMLTSGDEPDILALLRLYRRKFRDPKNVDASTIDSSIKEPLFERKKHLADEYCKNRFALSHDDFLNTGKQHLPADVFYDGIQKIAAINLKADLIIAGFINGVEELYHCDSSGKVSATGEYAAIGSGEYLAHAALLRREQNNITPLDVTLYNVFEAKRQAQMVGTVGERTTITILSPGEEESKLVSRNVMTQLQEMYVRHGPRPLPSDLKISGVYYYDEEKAARESL